MLRLKLIKSLVMVSLATQAVFAFGQSYLQRGQSNEPLPAIIAPNDAYALRNSSQKINRFLVNSVSWSWAGSANNYKIYPDLSFDFIRHYNFRINPSLKRNNKNENIPDGYYILRVVILKPKLIDGIETFEQMVDQYVTSAEREVEVQDGMISTPLSISFPSVTATTIMSRMFIEIIPLDENKSVLKFIEKNGERSLDRKRSTLVMSSDLPSVMMAIPFMPSAQNDTILSANRLLISDILYNSKIDLETLKLAGINKLTNDILNNKRIEDSQTWAKKQNLKVEYNDALFNQYANMKNKTEVCNAVDNAIPYKHPKFKNTTVEYRARYSLKNFCNSTKQSVTFQKVQFINENAQITLGPRNGATSQIVLSLSKGENESNGHDQTTSWTTSISLNPLEMIGVKLPGLSFTGNKNYGASDYLSRSQFSTGVFVENLVLEVNRISTQLKASKAQTCYVLKINKDHSGLKEKLNRDYLDSSFGKKANWGHMVCQTREYPTVLVENYFHILPAFKGQSIADSSDPRNQPINMSLRGYQELGLLKYQLRKNIQEKHSSDVMPHDLLTNTVIAQTTPGVHLEKIETDSNEPGFIDQVFYAKKQLEFN